LISRNSVEKLDLTKEKQQFINSSNNKNYSLINSTDKKVGNYISSPKNINTFKETTQIKSSMNFNPKGSPGKTSDMKYSLMANKNQPTHQRNTKSNFLNPTSDYNNIFSKATDTAKKLVGESSHNTMSISSNLNTISVNNVTKPQGFKIKNFHEVAKLGTLANNSNSARLGTNKNDLFTMNLYGNKKVLKK
jgi:hypothetical protein